jgi:hypothetical protein
MLVNMPLLAITFPVTDNVGAVKPVTTLILLAEIFPDTETSPPVKLAALARVVAKMLLAVTLPEVDTNPAVFKLPPVT